MGTLIRTTTADDMAPMFTADGRAFGNDYTQETIDENTLIDPDRFRIAVDGGDIVGVIGSFALDVALPGGALVPMGAVTWVSVAATHRRQGLLRRLMAAIHEDIDARGEPVAMLYASEGGIYERFGYGTATRIRHTRIVRANARLRPELVPPAGSVRYLTGDDAAAHVATQWDRYHRTRPGEVRRSDVWSDFLFMRRAKPESPSSSTHYLTHADGYAAYRIEPDWSGPTPAHRMHITELVALTDDAEVALWHALLGVDLVASLDSRQIAADTALPYLLTNPRAVETTGIGDGVWACVRDVAICFGARTYRVTDRLVVEVDGVRWSIDGSPDGAEVKRVRSRPDLVVTHDVLGALLLGGISPRVLAAGRRLTPRDAGALRRAELFFVGDVTPGSQTFY